MIQKILSSRRKEMQKSRNSLPNLNVQSLKQNTSIFSQESHQCVETAKNGISMADIY